jgi:hypothetical protein
MGNSGTEGVGVGFGAEFEIEPSAKFIV